MSFSIRSLLEYSRRDLEKRVFLFIFLSRVLFLSISPSFFDSLEYLKLFNLPSLGEALRQAHYPIHPLWIIAGWLFNKIPRSTTLFKIEFINAVLGTLSCFFIYKIASQWVDKKKAILLTSICAFLPYFWLSQTNVLYEPLLGVFLLGSFWFFIKKEGQGEKSGIRKIKNLLSGLLFAGAFLVSPTALFYLIFFAGFAFGKKQLGRLGLLGGLGIFLGLLGYLYVLRLREIPVGEIFLVLSAGNSILEKMKLEGVMFFARGIRNCLIVYFNYLTIPLGLVLGVLGMLGILEKRIKYLPIFWLIGFFFLNTVWHAGLYGRLSLFLFIPPVFLLGKFSEKILKLFLIFIVITSAVRVLPYRFKKTPYVLEKEYLEGNWKEKTPLLVISNYEEPYLNENFEVLVLNSPMTKLKDAKEKIKEELKGGRIILMTSQAVTAPYFQYDGMNYQILSKRKNYSKTQGQELAGGFEYEISYFWPKYNLKIYQLRLSF